MDVHRMVRARNMEVRRALSMVAFCAISLATAPIRAQAQGDPLAPLYEIYNSTTMPWHMRRFVGRTIRDLSRLAPPGATAARGIVTASLGGRVQRSDSAAVLVPPNALDRDLAIAVSSAVFRGDADETAKRIRMSAKGLTAAADAVEFGPEGTVFAIQAAISLPYDPSAVAMQGLTEARLQIYYWNRITGDWEPLPSVIDETKRLVTAQTDHFSLYQVLGSTGAATIAPLAAAADPTFTFHDAYAFPNPVRGTSVATIRIQVGVADSVEVHVYDVTGRHVHASSDFRQSIIDDLNGKGFQYTDDHVWDVSGIGSGVYTYVITAKKAGMVDVHKSGRVGIIK